MGKIYYPTDPADPTEFPSALAIGDSWFWYPNQNMMESLVRHPRIKAGHDNIRILGFNGAELCDYVGVGKYAKDINRWLSPAWNGGFSEFYISGAGNDAVRYQLALKGNCAGLTKPEDCFDAQGMDELLRRISEAMGSLIHNIRWAYRGDDKDRPIFIHGYDYPTPDNRGFNAGPIHSGPWLGKALDACAVDKDLGLRFEITKILIDRLNEEVFKPFNDVGNDVVYIDSRGTLRHYPDDYKDDWANELHPTSDGFGQIFDQHWLPALIAKGIAK